MTVVRETRQSAPVGVAIIDAPETLNILTNQDCAAAIWQRRPLPAFQTWLNGLDADKLPTARLILKPQSVVAVLSKLCDMSAMEDGPQRQRLIEDIAALSYLFCEVMDAPYMRLRLDAVSTNACRKFHIDAVTARLVCTYRGTGTQYGTSHNNADPKRVFTVPTGAPILLRGTLWPEKPCSGLRHRSPPIEGSGETRLVLVLDPIFEHEEVA